MYDKRKMRNDARNILVMTYAVSYGQGAMRWVEVECGLVLRCIRRERCRYQAKGAEISAVCIPQPPPPLLPPQSASSLPEPSSLHSYSHCPISASASPSPPLSSSPPPPSSSAPRPSSSALPPPAYSSPSQLP